MVTRCRTKGTTVLANGMSFLLPGLRLRANMLGMENLIYICKSNGWTRDLAG